MPEKTIREVGDIALSWKFQGSAFSEFAKGKRERLPLNKQTNKMKSLRSQETRV